MSDRLSPNWTVTIVSAFGRGETLALALVEHGFQVQVLDFTEALNENSHQGAGPFPILKTAYIPAQKDFLNPAVLLGQGMGFWLPDGPIELTGAMAEYHSTSRADVKNWRTGQKGNTFDTDWIQNFLTQMTSAYHRESWQTPIGSAFPAQMECGLIPTEDEAKSASFERYRNMKHPYQALASITGVDIDGRRLQSVENGETSFKAERWVWCLSAYESEKIAGAVAQKIFQQVNTPVWVWSAFDVKLTRGPWSNGFPEYFVLLSDLHLPWTHANMAIMRRLGSDHFRAWMKVPFAKAADPASRTGWAADLAASLMARLPLAKWQVSGGEPNICPHSPVFEAGAKDHHSRGCRNMEWIAPETLARLDWSARLETEAEVFERLSDWRTDQMRKQGAERDHTLHPS